MQKFIVYAALAATIGACTSGIPGSTTDSSLKEPVALTEHNLSGRWRLLRPALTGSDNRPPELEFRNGSVALLNGCNRLHASYSISGDQLNLGPVLSTRMACDSSLSAVDTTVSQLLGGHIRLERFVDSRPGAITMNISVHGLTVGRLSKITTD